MLQTALKKLISGVVENSIVNTKEIPQVFKISTDPHINTNLAEILVFVNGSKIKALLDLGATKSVINSRAKILESLNIETTNTILQCANGDHLQISGQVQLDVNLNNNNSKSIVAIVSNAVSHQFILGTDFIDTLSYDKNDRCVIVNDVKVQRFRPNEKPLLMRLRTAINLSAWECDQVVEFENPLFGIIDNQSVFIERAPRDNSRDQSFRICETINANSQYLKVNISNMTPNKIILRKGTIICQISPTDTVSNKIFTLTHCDDFDEEQQNLTEFQEKRKLKYFSRPYVCPIDIKNLSGPRANQLTNIFRENPLAFAANENDLGRIAFWRFSIPFLNENEECYQAPRPIPPGLREKVTDEFNKWKNNDLVEEAFSPVNIPVLIVRKSNGSVRLALDARKLNTLSVKDRFPMPNMADIFHRIGIILSEAEEPFMSSFDAKRAYNQLLLNETDKNKVAFSIFNRHYRAKRLVYGLQNGPSAFSRLMSNLFSDDEEIFVFIDDLLIISKNWENHVKAIERLLKKCISIGLVLDPTKSQIGKDECVFLGETITKTGRRPSTKHIDAIKQYPVPKTRKELKRFNGICVFEQKFIKNASVILKPLHQLASPKNDFVWTDEHQNAFETIKSELIKSTGIHHRDPNKQLVLTTDASLEAAGGILSQINSLGDYEPLGYFSRTFTDSEKRQSARHREAYAIHDAIKHFQFQLLGQKFIVETDHHSLIWLAKENLSQTLNMRMVNVYQFLSSFDFTIKYIPNTTDQIKAADALSRAIIVEGLTGIEKLVTKTNPTDHVFAIEHFDKNQINLVTRAKTYENNISDSEITLFRFADSSFTIEQFSKLQSDDKYCKSIKIKLECDCKDRIKRKNQKRDTPVKASKNCRKCKKSKYFCVKNNILYNTKLKKHRLVIPNSIALEFINFLHVSHLHPGAKALESIISRNVFIHNVQALSKQICARCFVCLQVKPRKPNQPSKVSLQPSAIYPFEYCAIDLIDHGKTDARGKRYLLVMVDLLSDFIDGIPLASKTDNLVSKAVLELILRHGAFENIISDNGREFGPIFNSICRKLHINPIKISPYNSRANRCERANRCIRIKERLAYLSRSNWSEAWNLIKFQLNNSPKDKLDGKTPFEVAYGRSMYTPYTNKEIDLVTNSNDWTKISSEYFNTLYPQLVKFQNDRIKIRNDQSDIKSLKKGQKVLIFKPTINDDGKISRFWFGPLTVIRNTARDSYELRCDRTQKIFRRNFRHIRAIAAKPLNAPFDDLETHNIRENESYDLCYIDQIHIE